MCKIEKSVQVTELLHNIGFRTIRGTAKHDAVYEHEKSCIRMCAPHSEKKNPYIWWDYMCRDTWYVFTLYTDLQ